MTDLTRDPIVNTVQNGIKRGIRVALENECLASAVLLTLSGMDAMAFVGMPAGQDDVTRSDFIAWADRYIHFPCKEQLSGMDLYGARCGALHSFGSASRLSREGKCRQVGYMSRCTPEVVFRPAVSAELVLVSVPALADAFFTGVDRYLVDLFSDTKRAALAEERFQLLFQSHPVTLPGGVAV